MNKTEKLEAIQKNLKAIDAGVFSLKNMTGLQAKTKSHALSNIDRILAETRAVAASFNAAGIMHNGLEIA